MAEEKQTPFQKFFGDYDYKFLFMPRLPWSKEARKLPPFFGVDEPVPPFVAIVMGLQHALAMISGIYTVPYVIAKFSMDGVVVTDDGVFAFKNEDLFQYIISAALISCGIMTFFQVMQFRIPFTKLVVGTGLVSVLGTSFTFLPIFEKGIRAMKPLCMESFGFGSDDCTEVNTRPFTDLKDYFPDRTCDSKPEDFSKDYWFRCDPSCASNSELKRCASELCGDEAHGRMLGSCVIACFLELFIALMPAYMIQRIFPPVVQATCVMLIGIGLIGSAIKYWGGGVVCGESDWRMHPQIKEVDRGFLAFCSGNGEVRLEYAAPEYLGLGISCWVIFIFIQMFGSPFAQNTMFIIAMFFGLFISAVSRYKLYDPETATAEEMVMNTKFKGSIPIMDCDVNGENCEPRFSAMYVTDEKIKRAKWFNFIWMKTFPLGIYPPVILPLLLGTVATTVETIGDLASSFDVSKLVKEGERYDRAMQGGLFADGIGSVMAALFTVTPNTTYSSNVGIVALTRCASRRCGVCVSMWLIFLGAFQKLAGLLTSVPDAILGGINSFLWCQVFVAGMNILCSGGSLRRRERFILGMSMGIGIGSAMIPQIFNDMREAPGTNSLWPCHKACEISVFVPSKNATETIPNPLYCDGTQQAIRSSVLITLGIPYLLGTLVAVFLNAILPEEDPDEDQGEGPVAVDGGDSLKA